MEAQHIVGLQQLLETCNGINQGTLKSYAMLTDKETLLVGHALTQTILQLNNTISQLAPNTDATLVEALLQQRQSLIALNCDLQTQLVGNAKPKPAKSEA